MITALIAAGLLGVGALALWATFYYVPARHAGGGEGALTVAYLVARVEAETSGGRHRLREPRTVQLRGDLADALAVEETRFLPLVESGLPVDDRHAMAKHPGLLRRVLAKLEDL
ncbi:hypothetical protein GCM10011581_46190 [Saccharopolyspora subtropica]|uniref:Uncharacterized protein n=1 Tax=Saccharopolyspora thermophila TaxID=89367 RepID=A0A917KAL2_9PSEU|nr:hypothetical protein [Saccharopolyspora subtropica]GGJ03949.1 hypothetical protein GCM10011581_46190 [Saccharopolyspora subtropica]